MFTFKTISEYELLTAAHMTILNEWSNAETRARECNYKVEAYNRIEDRLWKQLNEIRSRLDELYEERRPK